MQQESEKRLDFSTSERLEKYPDFGKGAYHRKNETEDSYSSNGIPKTTREASERGFDEGLYSYSRRRVGKTEEVERRARRRTSEAFQLSALNIFYLTKHTIDVANAIIGVLKNEEPYNITEVVNDILETYEIRRGGYTVYNAYTKKRVSAGGDGSLLEGEQSPISRGTDAGGGEFSGNKRNNNDVIFFYRRKRHARFNPPTA